MLFAANFSLFSLAPFKNQVWTRRYQVPGFVFGCWGCFGWGLKNLFWFIVIVFSFFYENYRYRFRSVGFQSHFTRARESSGPWGRNSFMTGIRIGTGSRTVGTLPSSRPSALPILPIRVSLCRRRMRSCWCRCPGDRHD